MKSVKVLMKFPMDEEGKPVTWMFATKYGLQFSILQADVKPGQGGRLIMDLTGEENSIKEALEFAQSGNK